MSDFRRHLKESMSDAEFKREWDAQSVERKVMRSIVEARLARGMSQKDLADACGMKASNLCRLESGSGNPSVATLAKIARGLGGTLEITFVLEEPAGASDLRECGVEQNVGTDA